MQTISNAQAASIKPVLDAKLSPDTTQVITDSASVYGWLLPPETHKRVNHYEELRTDGVLSTKTIEGAFSLFKRGVIGSYHKLSKDHVDSYLGEFCWRFNRRGMQPMMFGAMLREMTTKKPLTYKALTRDTF
jgi:transposase-like protein